MADEAAPSLFRSVMFLDSSAIRVAAWASISNQILYLVSCDQMATASGRE